MKRIAKLALGALLLAGTATLTAAPASAQSVGISFGFGPGYEGFSDPCDYYNYYDEAPPWGLPPDYCDYPVYFEPVFLDGYWYRGPIYYRWYGGERLFWLNGSWRRDQWRGGRPQIRWEDRGGWGRGHDSNRWSGGGDGRGHWSGGGGGGDNRGHWSGGGDRNWSGGGGGGDSRGHWSGGGGGNHNWSGGGGDHGGGGHWSGGGHDGGGHGGDGGHHH